MIDDSDAEHILRFLDAAFFKGISHSKKIFLGDVAFQCERLESLAVLLAAVEDGLSRVSFAVEEEELVCQPVVADMAQIHLRSVGKILWDES